MTQATIQNLEKEVRAVKKEVALLKLMLVQKIKDAEGEYRPEFIRAILKAAYEKPLYNYKKGKFLKQISR